MTATVSVDTSRELRVLEKMAGIKRGNLKLAMQDREHWNSYFTPQQGYDLAITLYHFAQLVHDIGSIAEWRKAHPTNG